MANPPTPPDPFFAPAHGDPRGPVHEPPVQHEPTLVQEFKSPLEEHRRNVIGGVIGGALLLTLFWIAWTGHQARNEIAAVDAARNEAEVKLAVATTRLATQANALTSATKRVEELERGGAKRSKSSDPASAAALPETPELREAAHALKDNFDDALQRGDARLSTDASGAVVLELADTLLFDASVVDINDGGEDALKEIAGVLATLKGHDVSVNAFSDTTPIPRNLRSDTPTNWELTAGRAITVVRFLQDKAGIDADHLRAAAYSQYHPRTEETGPGHKKRERRIEFVIR